MFEVNNMETLLKEYDRLQCIYGDSSLNSIYGGGKASNPDICLVFINPTARNLASNKDWKGIRYPWLATKQIWKFLTRCGLFSETLNNKIQSMKASDWDDNFAKEVYQEVENKGMYITNLAKCTQLDARHLNDEIYQKYKEYFLEEIDLVKPKKILLFGNQISSILLEKNITVSTCRRKKFTLKTKKNSYETYAVYYPVGNGFFNVDKAIEDIKEIVASR